MPSTPLQMICISIMFFGNVVNNLTTSFQYSSMLFFHEYSDLFRIVKTMDALRTTFLEFPYEGKSLSASLQHRRPTSYLYREILRRKKLNFCRRVSIFVFPIPNKSPFSGKIITSFKIERMWLNLLTICPKHKIEMQITYDGWKVHVLEFVFHGLNIEKWSIGKHCDGVAVVENVKTIMCQKGGTLPLMLPSANRPNLMFRPTETTEEVFLYFCSWMLCPWYILALFTPLC